MGRGGVSRVDFLFYDEKGASDVMTRYRGFGGEWVKEGRNDVDDWMDVDVSCGRGDVIGNCHSRSWYSGRLERVRVRSMTNR